MSSFPACSWPQVLSTPHPHPVDHFSSLISPRFRETAVCLCGTSIRGKGLLCASRCSPDPDLPTALLRSCHSLWGCPGWCQCQVGWPLQVNGALLGCGACLGAHRSPSNCLAMLSSASTRTLCMSPSALQSSRQLLAVTMMQFVSLETLITMHYTK